MQNIEIQSFRALRFNSKMMSARSYQKYLTPQREVGFKNKLHVLDLLRTGILQKERFAAYYYFRLRSKLADDAPFSFFLAEQAPDIFSDVETSETQLVHSLSKIYAQMPIKSIRRLEYIDSTTMICNAFIEECEQREYDEIVSLAGEKFEFYVIDDETFCEVIASQISNLDVHFVIPYIAKKEEDKLCSDLLFVSDKNHVLPPNLIEELEGFIYRD